MSISIQRAAANRAAATGTTVGPYLFHEAANTILQVTTIAASSTQAATLSVSSFTPQQLQFEVADANEVMKRFYEIEPRYSKLFERLAKL